MMDLYSKCICIFIALLHLSECSGNMRGDQKSIRVTYAPKRFRSFEASVKLTFRFGRSNKRDAQIILLKIFNRKAFVTAINKTLSVNETQLDIPCDVFAKPGRYVIEYFIQGLTKTFILLTTRPIIVRRERVEIDVPKNHTAFDGAVSAWLSSTTSTHRRCKPLKGKLKLYWIKNSKEHILATTKIVNKDKIEERTRVNFRCKLFDTTGIFYFAFYSDYSNRIIGKSQNMSVSWGNYEITTQSKHIFPCSNTFVIKSSSPHCDPTKDKIEMRSTASKEVLDSQVAFHGFRSVIFFCDSFERHIREYCFDYITNSSLTKKGTIQATLCIPSKKTEPRWTDWSEWSAWGSCTSVAGCGNGRKYRLRFCPLDSYPKLQDNSKCTGRRMDSMSCTLPPCKECKSCGCVFSTPGGTIVSPKYPLPLLTTTKRSSCQWSVRVAEGMKVKLWFDSLRLAINSSVIIRDGNSSASEILKRITHDSEDHMEDIYSTSNVVSIWYSRNRIFLRRNNTGFQLSYASFEETKTSVSVMSTNKKSGTRRLAKMTFIGILAALVIITFTIIAVIIARIRRQRSNENTAKTVSSQRPSSSHTSTACVSESTIRSYYEPQLSADESINNNSSSLSQPTNYHRPRLPARIEHRPSVHVCPRCCAHAEQYPGEYNNDCSADVSRRILYPDPYCTSNAENTQTVGRVPRVHSIIEHRLSGTSLVSEGDFPQRNYPTYF